MCPTCSAATPFALSIMQKMNDKCKEWKTAENIDYSLYGTPLESTTYKFAKCLQKRFGIIEGVTDKGYITNSYHVRVKGADGKMYLAHTLNNTCVAPPRMLIAFLENHLQKDGSSLHFR